MTSEFVAGEFQVTPTERVFEAWIMRVEILAGGFAPDGCPMLMSDEALAAYQDGISANDYALQVQLTAALLNASFAGMA